MKLGDAKPQTNTDAPRLEELVELVKFPSGKWVQIRIIPSDIVSMRQHWINILTSKTKREVRIPKMCLAHDPLTEELSGKCPYCEIESQTSTSYLLNVIVRTLQEDMPNKIRVTSSERESGFKDFNSESWTPVRVFRVPAGFMKSIQELKDLNKVKGTKGVKAFDVDHPKFGVDLSIKYDENAKGGKKYQVNKGERSPLTEEELSFLKWDLSVDLVRSLGVESVAQATKELSRMQIVGASEFGEEDDDELGAGKKRKQARGYSDDDDEPAPRGKKPTQVKKRQPVDDDEDDLGDDDDGDLDDDDEPAPRGKKPAQRPAQGKKRQPVDEDDEDDDADDEPAPRSRKQAPKPTSGKKRPTVDDDLDDGDDGDEPEPRRKKPAPTSSKKRPPVDDDLDDGDDDDEPAPRGKKPASKPTSRKPRKPVDDDLDDDDGDDDDLGDDDIPF